MGEQRDWSFIYPGILPGLNELIKAAKQRYRRAAQGGREASGYSRLKATHTAALVACMKTSESPLVCFTVPVDLSFVWREPNRKRDPDNIAAGGRKLILDALVHAGILRGDGWAHVAGWTDTFVHCPRGSTNLVAGITVTITEATDYF